MTTKFSHFEQQPQTIHVTLDTFRYAEYKEKYLLLLCKCFHVLFDTCEFMEQHTSIL